MGQTIGAIMMGILIFGPLVGVFMLSVDALGLKAAAMAYGTTLLFIAYFATACFLAIGGK